MVEYCVTGTVLSTVNNIAKIKITQNSACDGSIKGCNACKGFFGRQEFIVEAENKINAKEGDRVKIKIQSPDYYKALIIVFIMPIAFLLAGYIFGLSFNKILINAEYYLAIISFLIAFFIVSILSKNLKSKYQIIELA